MGVFTDGCYGCQWKWCLALRPTFASVKMAQDAFGEVGEMNTGTE